MNHDIFISYSHKNITAAQAICHELEDKGIKCWMAPRDIPVGAKYASVISKAIVHSRIVVLVFSDYSARSPWVESEINIAFSNRKTIIPYKIDKTNYEEFDEFYLMLNNRHWIEAYPDYKTRFKELVTIVAQTLGRNVSASKPAESHEPAPTPILTPTPTPSEPKNLKRYWWVALCLLAICCVGWYISTDKEEVMDHPIKELIGVADASIVSAVQNSAPESDSELEELRAEKMRIEKENETLKQNNAELQHTNTELQNSNSDLQKNINNIKAKETQQSKNKPNENQTVKSSTQKPKETKSSISSSSTATTSTPKAEQKSAQTTNEQKIVKEESIISITQPQTQVKQEVVVVQPKTPKEEVVEKDDNFAEKLGGKTDLLSLPDSEFVVFESENGKKGYKLKSTNEVIIPAKYYYARDFTGGLAGVSEIERGGHYGFINKKGEAVTEFKYDTFWECKDGLIRVGGPNKKNARQYVEGYIDKRGEEVIPLQFYIANDFSEGLAAVKIKEKGGWGFIDKGGNMVIPYEYNFAGSFKEGLAKVGIKGYKHAILLGYGFIDKTGKVVIPLIYDEVEDFNGGRAKVKYLNEWFYIDKNGNRVE